MHIYTCGKSAAPDYVGDHHRVFDPPVPLQLDHVRVQLRWWHRGRCYECMSVVGVNGGREH